jgi:hypothetical protein
MLQFVTELGSKFLSMKMRKGKHKVLGEERKYNRLCGAGSYCFKMQDLFKTCI